MSAFLLCMYVIELYIEANENIEINDRDRSWITKNERRATHSTFETEPYFKCFLALGSFLYTFISVLWRMMINSVETVDPACGRHAVSCLLVQKTFFTFWLSSMAVRVARKETMETRRKKREKEVSRRRIGWRRITGEKPEQEEGEMLYLLEWVRHRESDWQGFSVNTKESKRRTLLR